MKSAITYVAVLIAVVMLSPDGYAQTFGNYLEDFESIRIVTFLSGTSESCKVTEEDLRSAAEFPVATSRLRIDETSHFRLSVEVALREAVEDGTKKFIPIGRSTSSSGNGRWP